MTGDPPLRRGLQLCLAIQPCWDRMVRCPIPRDCLAIHELLIADSDVNVKGFEEGNQKTFIYCFAPSLTFPENPFWDDKTKQNLFLPLDLESVSNEYWVCYSHTEWYSKANLWARPAAGWKPTLGRGTMNPLLFFLTWTRPPPPAIYCRMTLLLQSLGKQGGMRDKEQQTSLWLWTITSWLCLLRATAEFCCLLSPTEGLVHDEGTFTPVYPQPPIHSVSASYLPD